MRRVWIALYAALALASTAEARGGHSGGRGGGHASAHRSFSLGSSPRYHSVRGYTRRDGTYVAPHHATNPNGTRADNWSTRGNVNPFTGRLGTRSPEGGVGYAGAGRMGLLGGLGAVAGVATAQRLARPDRPWAEPVADASLLPEEPAAPEAIPVAAAPSEVGGAACEPETPGYLVISGVARCPDAE